MFDSNAPAALASKEIQQQLEDTDEYDADSEILDQKKTDHRYPPTFRSDSEESEDDNPNQKISESNHETEHDENEIDLGKVHEVFDELNKIYKNGDEPIWEVAAEESEFDSSTIVKNIISNLKENSSGKDLLAKIRNKKK